MPARFSTHPKGTRATVLLSSVFGPYAQDDAFGSRALNPMELYQNQVTRAQGVFSLRMFHPSFGLLMLQANMEAPCTVLDFPSQARFIQELKAQPWDIVGIGAIAANIGKVRRMCALIRAHQPRATIVVGGHIAAKPDLGADIEADHIVRGDGIRWFRSFLGQDPQAPVRHPRVTSAFGARVMGIPLREDPGDTAAILIPSVGCPVGCPFCSTSALFGGKGHHVNFFETGDELFAVMNDLEREMRVQSFFVLDENFLLHRRRALRLLELMQAHAKSWMLNIFSSARVLQAYTMEQLVGLGIGWVWMGIEGRGSGYRKLEGVDTRALIRRLQAHGIRVLGSSIIGLDHHTPEAMDGIIADAVDHASDFHQFMLYTPVPGTPLHERHRRDGTLLPEERFPLADAHGQYRFNYRHGHIPAGQEEILLGRAFARDYEVNGPSLARLIRTLLTGWQRHRHHPELRVRARLAREVRPLRDTYAGAVWAMRRHFRGHRHLFARMDDLLRDLYREFGLRTRLLAPWVGRYAYRRLRGEARRLAAGWSYEPECRCTRNAAALTPASGAAQVAPAAVGGLAAERG